VDEVNKLELKYLTSIIVVEDDVKLTLAFSFEKKLIEDIFKEYSKGIEIENDEVPIYIEETAGDMINIVMGNVLSYFQQLGKTIVISSPIIINGAKSISRYKDSRFYSADMLTDKGEMVIYCITPGEKIMGHLKSGRR
jgi:CheY-specific phosphatase CheX